MSWFIFSIIAFIFFGLQKFFLKVAAERGYASSRVTLTFMATVCLLSLIPFFITSRSYSDLKLLLIFALANAVAFILSIIFRIESLRHLPASIAYSIQELSKILPVLFGIVYFKEMLTPAQIAGVIIGLTATFLLTKTFVKSEKYTNPKLGYIFLVFGIIASALAATLPKFAAIASYDTLLFIAVSYFYNVIFLFSYGYIEQHLSKTDKKPLSFHLPALRFGVLIGVVNFIAFYAMMKALMIGPLSLVTIIISFSGALATLLSLQFYKETLSPLRITGIILSVIALILVR